MTATVAGERHHEVAVAQQGARRMRPAGRLGIWPPSVTAAYPRIPGWGPGSTSSPSPHSSATVSSADASTRPRRTRRRGQAPGSPPRTPATERRDAVPCNGTVQAAHVDVDVLPTSHRHRAGADIVPGHTGFVTAGIHRATGDAQHRPRAHGAAVGHRHGPPERPRGFAREGDRERKPAGEGRPTDVSTAAAYFPRVRAPSAPGGSRTP